MRISKRTTARDSRYPDSRSHIYFRLFVASLPNRFGGSRYPAPEPTYGSLEEILLNPQPITIRVHSTGIMETSRSAIMESGA